MPLPWKAKNRGKLSLRLMNKSPFPKGHARVKRSRAAGIPGLSIEEIEPSTVLGDAFDMEGLRSLGVKYIVYTLVSRRVLPPSNRIERAGRRDRYPDAPVLPLAQAILQQKERRTNAIQVSLLCRQN